MAVESTTDLRVGGAIAALGVLEDSGPPSVSEVFTVISLMMYLRLTRRCKE